MANFSLLYSLLLCSKSCDCIHPCFFSVIPAWNIFLCHLVNLGKLSHNLRIIWVEEDPWELSSPTCPWQGRLSLDPVAQSPIQPNVEHFQWRLIHKFLGQPIPVSHHPHCERFLPYIQTKSNKNRKSSVYNRLLKKNLTVWLEHSKTNTVEITNYYTETIIRI